jgi:formate dehydrogenase iron-sulfur subunit
MPATITPKALLIDIVKCVGCRACVGACLEEHGLRGDPDKVTGLGATALTALYARGDRFVRDLCRHCLEPSCASVCPSGALRKTAAGPVVYDAAQCLGCRYCVQACPFNVPKYEWDRPAPAVTKCDFCVARQSKGKPTACAEACPAEATVFGARDELIAEARRRIAAEPDTYHGHVWGETEVGGTSVLFLSPVPFSELGFPASASDVPPRLTHAALAKIPHVVSVGGAFLFGLWWITKRRDEVARAEAAALKENRHDA